MVIGMWSLVITRKGGSIVKKIITSILVVVVFLTLASQVLALTPKPQKGQKIERLTGRVTSIDTSEMTMVVESRNAGMTFDIGGAKLKGYKTVNNIKEGDRVTVQFVMSRGKATARTITKNKSYRGGSAAGVAIISSDHK